MTKSFPGLPGPTTCSIQHPWTDMQRLLCTHNTTCFQRRKDDTSSGKIENRTLGMSWQLDHTFITSTHSVQASGALAFECLHCRHKALVSQCNSAACLGPDAAVRRPQAAIWKSRPVLPDNGVELVTYFWTCLVLHFVNPLHVRAKAGSSLKIQGQMHP